MHDIVLKCFIICKTNIGTIQGSLISQRLIDATKFNGFVTFIQFVIYILCPDLNIEHPIC